MTAAKEEVHDTTAVVTCDCHINGSARITCDAVAQQQSEEKPKHMGFHCLGETNQEAVCPPPPAGLARCDYLAWARDTITREIVARS